ncbi:disease resistance protein RPV1-like isoform X1 [Lotus japonicus]|uniref:disease resistance protein RPV1-like isoform X1 n=1 Tax=Lotus japonicus TaxID=34305 RepID=UPI00258FEA8C|nr:disease resistance protein RPV1-like isoform X1 [Lotus japonicus]
MSASSSSSSAAAAVMAPPSPPPKYDVFVSFRGEDTRDNFTSHFYAELSRKNIQAFIDNRLGRGDEISPALHTAIEDSMIYVIVFSEHYASSSWCLDELARILECRKRYGREVIPVFYKVNPSSVRHQEQSYADAFAKHELGFKDEVIRRWKAALAEAAGISGWDSNTTRSESMLIDRIVEDILKKLNRSVSSETQGMVGIDKHIAQIQSLLQLQSAAVRIIGIWGMRGIGKTTLVEAYHKLGTQFSSRSLTVNAQQEIERVGTNGLRQKYLSELLDEGGSTSNGSGFADERLKQAKVLLILDDVKNSSQIQELIRGRGYFSQGSRIIVTSRDRQVLHNARVDEIYEVKEMSYKDSLQLFSLHAFKQKSPVGVNADLADKVLEYAKGISIALKVLGSLLYGRTRKVWESHLEKLPDDQIFSVLKLSYDGLDDEHKDIFLDIACFYRGHSMNVAVDLLDGCGFSADIGIDVLKDRGLIYILEDQIRLHDLIWDMGKQIVRQQCLNDPGKRSRLWKHKEVYDVLRKNQGTGAIQCISTDLYKIKEVELQYEIFKSMPNLRMLYFYTKAFWFGRGQSNVILPTYLESLPDGLKVLYWDRFPLRSLPLNFCSENLVKLYMHHSQLKQLWKDDQELPNLKRLDLSHSSDLIRIPGLSLFPNIEEIILSDCKSLIQVYSSSFLSKLKCLWLIGCVKLRSLNVPSRILSRSSGSVGLYNCCKLETFSINRTEVVESSGHSHFDGLLGAFEIYDDAKGASSYQEMNGLGLDEKYSTNLEWFRKGKPSRVSHELCWLDLGSCESLTMLPIDLCKLKLLRRLDLSGCSNLEKFPEIVDTMENLAVLVLDQTAIQELPSSLDRLVGLEELSLHKCRRLEIIPSSIGRLTKLCKLNLTCCVSLETFPSSIFKLKLTELDLFCCSKLKTLPKILEPAESFAHINLSYTSIKELPSSLDFLVGLQTLCLEECRNLESLPNIIGNLNILSDLDCTSCSNLTEIPNDIGRLLSLRKLSLCYTRMVNLPESIAQLSSLESLDVRDCRELECIPQHPPFLIMLLAFRCPSIRRVLPNSRVKPWSGSREGSDELDPSAYSDVVADARVRIIEDAYRFVYYCFPGSEVPDWFPYSCEGNSVTMDQDFQYWCNDNRLIGFAMCVVLPVEDVNCICYLNGDLRCRLTFESDGNTHILPNNVHLHNSFYRCSHRMYNDMPDHTFIGKYYFRDSAGVDIGISYGLHFTFGISLPWLDFESSLEVKECGIWPLYQRTRHFSNKPIHLGPHRSTYTKERDDIGSIVDSSSFPRVSNNDFEERKGKRKCLG